MTMEFWGVEVRSGESMKVKSGGSFGLHLSQASLGEFQKEKGNESVFLYVTIGDRKLVLGTLSPQKFPQLSFDLVFNEDFELSHTWKSGSVYFLGYRGPNGSDTSSEDEDESEEDLPIIADNGKPKLEAKQTKPIAESSSTLKPDSTVAKQKVKIVEPSKDAKFDEENDDSIDEEDDSLSDDQAMSDDEDEDDDDDNEDDDRSDEEGDESDDEDKEMQKEAEIGKKRTADSAMKAAFSNKKARLVTPEKTDGKKVVVHVATPHPSKQAVKTSGNSSQNKGQSPKMLACNFCSRSFGSENALQSHKKAKHSAAH